MQEKNKYCIDELQDKLGVLCNQQGQHELILKDKRQALVVTKTEEKWVNLCGME